MSLLPDHRAQQMQAVKRVRRGCIELACAERDFQRRQVLWSCVHRLKRLLDMSYDAAGLSHLKYHPADPDADWLRRVRGHGDERMAEDVRRSVRLAGCTDDDAATCRVLADDIQGAASAPTRRTQ